MYSVLLLLLMWVAPGYAFEPGDKSMRVKESRNTDFLVLRQLEKALASSNPDERPVDPITFDDFADILQKPAHIAAAKIPQKVGQSAVERKGVYEFYQPIGLLRYMLTAGKFETPSRQPVHELRIYDYTPDQWAAFPYRFKLARVFDGFSPEPMREYRNSLIFNDKGGSPSSRVKNLFSLITEAEQEDNDAGAYEQTRALLSESENANRYPEYDREAKRLINAARQRFFSSTFWEPENHNPSDKDKKLAVEGLLAIPADSSPDEIAPENLGPIYAGLSALHRYGEEGAPHDPAKSLLYLDRALSLPDISQNAREGLQVIRDELIEEQQS